MTDLVPVYEPREHFLEFHGRSQRWASLVVHRRGGKTVACVNEALTRAVYTQKKNARYAYIAPFYRQAKDVAWQYLKDFGGPFIEKIRESQLRVELFNGAWITLYGADNPDALRGLYLDGVVLDEYGDCRPSLWGQVVLPTLADRKGWAVFIGTPKGKNHFYEIHKRSQVEDNWFSMTLPASQSDVLDDVELGEMRAQMTESAYNQELECDFDAAVLGTYYADLIQKLEIQNQIRPDVALYDPEEPVFMACDLGFSDSTAMWFWQRYGDAYSIIDYREGQGKLISEYLTLLDSLPYKYDTLYFPHDARASHVTGRSTIEQVENHFKGTDVTLQIIPKLQVQHGIDAVRALLPKCYINSKACYDGIEALRAYRRTYDEVKKVFSDKPLHDWASDGADAFRYFALSARPSKNIIDRPRQEKLTKSPEMKLNELWKDRENRDFGFERLRIG